MRQIHLWPAEAKAADGRLIRSVVLEGPEQRRMELWYRLPREHAEAVTNGCDPFVVASLFQAMRQQADLVVHGEASPSLLANLDEFQRIWTCWLPQLYTAVEVIPEVVREQPQAPSPGILASFSGGIDSSYSVYRHHLRQGVKWRPPLKAGLMVHGFDIPLERADLFASAFEKSETMLKSIGIDLIPLATNYRALGEEWEHCFAAGTAAALMLLQKRYTMGLIGSARSYNRILIPWGSTPLSDYLLSSASFAFAHDGGMATRCEKILALADWPEAQRLLRVCWAGPDPDRNCCRCEKCIRTILMYRALGLGLPPCFDQDVADEQINSLEAANAVQLEYLREIVAMARERGDSRSWVRVLERRVALLERGNRPLFRAWQLLRMRVALRTRLRRLVHGLTEPSHQPGAPRRI